MLNDNAKILFLVIQNRKKICLHTRHGVAAVHCTSVLNSTNKFVLHHMSKVELLNTSKGAYYRLDLNIKIFFLLTGYGAIYCKKMAPLQMC